MSYWINIYVNNDTTPFRTMAHTYFCLRTWPTSCLLQFCHLFVCLVLFFLMHVDYTDIQIFFLNTFMLSIHAQDVHTFTHLDRRVFLPTLSSGHLSLGDTAFSHGIIITETSVKLLTGHLELQTNSIITLSGINLWSMEIIFCKKREKQLQNLWHLHFLVYEPRRQSKYTPDHTQQQQLACEEGSLLNLCTIVPKRFGSKPPCTLGVGVLLT